jgi:transcriptional regulator with XRE-family HTH domain
MIKLGNKIRTIRKDRGLTMKQLAERVGVSYLTIFRVETGKVSPSVVLLSEIAQCLGSSIVSLIEEDQKDLVLIKGENQQIVESEKLRLKLLVPQGMINDQISISLGTAGPGKIIGRHKTEGHEFAYIIRGKCLFTYGGVNHELNRGDLVYFNGEIAHSVTALEKLEFLALYFRPISK